jgi:hypothetical protein
MNGARFVLLEPGTTRDAISRTLGSVLAWFAARAPNWASSLGSLSRPWAARWRSGSQSARLPCCRSGAQELLELLARVGEPAVAFGSLGQAPQAEGHLCHATTSWATGDWLLPYQTVFR